MLQRVFDNGPPTSRTRSRDRRALLFRGAAGVLVVIFAVAALHELFFLLHHEDHGHDHENCPLCLLVHTPVLFGICVILLVGFVATRSIPLPHTETVVTGRFAFQPDPRAPPRP